MLYISVSFSLGLEVGSNNSQTGIFALSARVGLERDIVVASKSTQVILQVVDQQLVSLGLRWRLVGMDRGKVRPRAGDHFGGGVQLHCARTL